jgi:putative DNA primase/helicase
MATDKPSKPARIVTATLVRDALASIPPDLDRETWVRLAMAIKAELGADGFDVWDAWSQNAKDYRESDARDTWRSVKAGGRVGIGTLFHLAKQHGFRFPDDDTTPPPSAAELQRVAAERERREKQQQADEAEYRRRAEQATREAAKLWGEAQALYPANASASPYLVRKGVKPYGVRLLPNAVLAVPMHNAAGELVNLQRIAAQRPTPEEEEAGAREKRYLPGGRKKGARHWLGAPAGQLLYRPPGEPAGPAVLCLAEGYATAASCHEATGWPVAVCFDSGNLVEVARTLPELLPGAAFLVLTDDDAATATRTGKNPGRVAAAAAVRLLRKTGARAWAVCPSDHPEGSNADFNDMHQAQGLDAVRAALQAARADLCGDAALTAKTGAEAPNAGAPGGSSPGVKKAAAAARSAGEGAGSAGAGQDGQDQAGTDKPRDGDPFTLTKAGVHFTARDPDGNPRKPEWLCAWLQVGARTRSEAAEGWGYLLEFTDPDGNPKQWAMPAALLAGEGSEWAGRLRDMGLHMAPGTKARNLLARYIDTRNSGERVTCTDRVGWHGAGVYVLPTGCIAPPAGTPSADHEADDAQASDNAAPARRFVLQSEAGMDNTFHRKGELADWQRTVAAPAAGNSRLVFAISAALAGPLLHLAKLESGGFHFRGASSQGKTTALRVAASVFGRPSFMQRWRTTDNALEAIAVQHCDALLILDEFGQLDPKVAGECAYLLANEQEKGRGTRAGLARRRRTWRLLFLSSGEIGLSDHMAEAGKRTRAGQEVRMVDIPLDAGLGMGGLENTHGAESPGAFVERITRAAATHYGTAGRVLIEWAAEHFAELPALLRQQIDHHRDDFTPTHAAEQVRRVAMRFALVAAAGELASGAGITGWAKGEAAAAARSCFNAWLAARGHVENGEEVAMLRQVAAFLEKNGDALFTWLQRAADDHRPNTALRAGFKRLVDKNGEPIKWDGAQEWAEKGIHREDRAAAHGRVEYLVLPEAFKREVCKGFEAQAVAKVLRAAGVLITQKDRLTNKVRIPTMGENPISVFHITGKLFELAGEW